VFQWGFEQMKTLGHRLVDAKRKYVESGISVKPDQYSKERDVKPRLGAVSDLRELHEDVAHDVDGQDPDASHAPQRDVRGIDKGQGDDMVREKLVPIPPSGGPDKKGVEEAKVKEGVHEDERLRVLGQFCIISISVVADVNLPEKVQADKIDGEISKRRQVVSQDEDVLDEQKKPGFVGGERSATLLDDDSWNDFTDEQQKHHQRYSCSTN